MTFDGFSQGLPRDKIAAGKFYVTTAIPYVNGIPHMGHALEFVQTDAIARYHKLRGESVFVTTGTDENSLKSVRAAAKESITTQEFCDNNARIFREFSDKIGLAYDSFIRSSDHEQHWKGVERLWELCLKSGDIYKKSYSGLYCVGCEAFYTESELTGGLCPEHLTAPERVTEENYFFRLSKYEKTLKELIKTNKFRITPETRKNEVLGFMDQGLEDFSVSRSTERSKGWGIPVPGDPSQTVYVWFDALGVYLSGVGFEKNDEQFKRLWPADMHVIGKGVIRFHAVYWPAMLLSAGLDLPKEIFVHGYVTAGGKKMGKSIGNAVDPAEMMDKYSVEALRYYLLRSIPTFDDGDFSESDLIKATNTELVGNIGNFIHRTLVFINKNFGGEISADVQGESGLLLLRKADAAIKEFDADLSEGKIGSGMNRILELAGEGNKYFQDRKPWELVASDKEGCKETLFVCANICKFLGVMLYPYTPTASERLLGYFGISGASLKTAIAETHGEIKISEPQLLFKKIDERAELKK